jgi:hypothetical protein
MGTGKDP